MSFRQCQDLKVFFAALYLLTAGCSLRLTPLQQNAYYCPSIASQSVRTQTRSVAQASSRFAFFDEDLPAGGFTYAYPAASKINFSEEHASAGEVSLRLDLDPSDWSGAAVSVARGGYDLTALRVTGALVFDIKGAQGLEKAEVALVDDEENDGRGSIVKLSLDPYCKVSDSWQTVRIPLRKFGLRGNCWDEQLRMERPEPFDWKRVRSFRITSRKDENQAFRVWIDNIAAIEGTPDETEPADDPWERIPESVATYSNILPLLQTSLFQAYAGEIRPGSFTYAYGGRSFGTEAQLLGNERKSALMFCFDNAEYSGIALNFGAPQKLDALRRKGAGLSLLVKGGTGARAFYAGLIDDESDGRKTQSLVAIHEYCKLDTNWQLVRIPLSEFSDKGRYWDEVRKVEIVKNMDWDKIDEIRISTRVGENTTLSSAPLILYIGAIEFIDSVPGHIDMARYWQSFKSDAPDQVLHTFTTPERWDGSAGAASTISCSVETAPERNVAALRIQYALGDWADAVCDYTSQPDPFRQRDWRNHWGLSFNLYTEKSAQPVTVRIGDTHGELFITPVSAQNGWSEIHVPFRDFSRFSWQPPDAVQNRRLDLDSVRSIDFKPCGMGSTGTFYITDVRLTNRRPVPGDAFGSRTKVTLRQTSSTSIGQVNPRIFGVNVESIDTDLLLKSTREYLRDAQHPVLRFPGGLGADKYHWEDALENTHDEVGTDEFLKMCDEIRAEPMITVNFGTGTPQEAAAWVAFTNGKRPGRVKYWEIGNELYGDWHPSHCTAAEYGQRCREFVVAMKNADPTIEVAVVWTLAGPWNREVFEYVKDVADAVCVHHYMYDPGEENDRNLLNLSSSIQTVSKMVSEQLTEFGAKGRQYKVWLSEWNSVSGNPGPQTLSIVNALFAASYLGSMAATSIDQAHYWAVHNRMDERMGDHGYLSRTGDEEGDNVRRPSYHAFAMARRALQGELYPVECSSSIVDAFLSKNTDTLSLMLINKHPTSIADVALEIPGMSGKGTVQCLTQGHKGNMPDLDNIELSGSAAVSLPPYSLTVISVKENAHD